MSSSAELDATAAFDRLVCLAHLVLAHAEVEAWYEVPFESRAPIEANLGRLVAPLLDGTLPASPHEQRICRKYVEMWSTADRHNAGWRMECAVVLAWALQLRNELPPFDQQTTQASFLEDLVDPSSRAEQRARAQLRSRSDLEALHSDAARWWRRASTAQPAYAALTEPASTLSKKKQSHVRGILGAPATLFGKPYECLTRAEMSTAFSIALERFKAISWLLAGGAWDAAGPESSTM